MRRGKPITSHITCSSVFPKMFAHHPKVYCRFVHMHRLSSPLPLPPCWFVHVHSVCCRFVHARGLAGCLCDGAIPSHYPPSRQLQRLLTLRVECVLCLSEWVVTCCV